MTNIQGPAIGATFILALTAAMFAVAAIQPGSAIAQLFWLFALVGFLSSAVTVRAVVLSVLGSGQRRRKH